MKTWPASGRHILAQFDDETIVVYQAYSSTIGRFAVEHQRFGGEFKYSRMSWIKPNFLWMMYRSDWSRSDGQQVVLGVRIRRAFFDEILVQAVPSSYAPEQFTLVEHTANDSYWGDGGDGSGKNKLGQILMQVREELRGVDA